MIGGCGPANGSLIMLVMSEAGMAQYLGENVMEAVYPFIILMFSFSVIAGLGKAMQRAQFSVIEKNLNASMRSILYDKILRKDMGWHDDRNNSSGVIGTMLNA